MSIRRLLLAVLGVALVLAVVGRLAGHLDAANEGATSKSAAQGGEQSEDTEEPPVERALEHDPFEEIEDSHHFEILKSLHIHIPLGPFITKFMVLELIAAGLIAGIYIPLARRLQSGLPPRGAWDNAFEGMLVFVRDEVAKPKLGV